MRLRFGLAALLSAIVLSARAHDKEEQGDPNVCRCAISEQRDGWCAKHKIGFYGGQRIESAAIFRVLDLHGHDVDRDKTACPNCRDLIRSGGFCDNCNMGFVNGHGYFSKLCYFMALGKPASEAGPRKSCCPKGDGWCDACRRGYVGNRIYERRGDFDSALRCFAIFKEALRSAARCEGCAIAMIADSRCPACRVVYRDGHPVSPPKPAQPDGANDDSREKRR